MDFPHCTFYDISVAIQPEKVHPAYKLYGGTIDVDCVATIENCTNQKFNSVPFLLYRLLDIEHVSDVSGKDK